MQRPVVRLSRGAFPAAKYAIARDRLHGAHASLAPATKELSGCLRYCAGVGSTTKTLINARV